MALTDKQQRFVEEYLVDLNATQAAIRAGYSEKTAKDIGCQNLAKLEVANAIAAAMAERSKRTKVTADKVITELAKIAFTDIRQAVRWGRSPIDTKSENADPNGLGMFPVELIPSEQVDDDTAAAISEVSLTQSGVKIKMHDKQAALEKLGRHLALFTDNLKVSGQVNHKHEQVANDADAFESRIAGLAARSGEEGRTSKPH